MRYELVGFLPGHPSATAIYDPADPDAGATCTLPFMEYGSALLT